MIEVADIFRLHGPAYRQTHRLLPSQHKAIVDILNCRTAILGGELYRCDDCGQEHYSYHSCGNRHCPKCHGQQTERWLEAQQQRLLACAYYFLTFTLPAELRSLALGNQKAIYALLLSAAAAALQKLAWDPRWVGGQLAILAVLHTWRRDLGYHPHVHLLVSAGGLSGDGQRWMPAKNPAFLVPGYALSPIFRGKFRSGLKKLGLLAQVPAAVWTKKWNVQIQHAGKGEKVLDYLGRYAFRIAISNSRIERFENGQVTFGYRDNKTQQLKHPTFSAEEFIRRFLLHVLPRGFVKVRAYGLWSGHGAEKRKKAQALLAPCQPTKPTISEPELDSKSVAPEAGLPLCPKCKKGHLIFVARLSPQRTRAP
jgi:hypothetical protein